MVAKLKATHMELMEKTSNARIASRSCKHPLALEVFSADESAFGVAPHEFVRVIATISESYKQVSLSTVLCPKAQHARVD